MHLSEIRASYLRNFEQFSIEPDKGINLFCGENASGKTTILEAIYFLSRVKSFRTKKLLDVVKTGQPQVVIHGVLKEGHQRMTLGVEKNQTNTRLKVNGEAVRSSAEQARRLPLLMIMPDGGQLFTGTPKDRRHWLDWSLFHVKPGFLDTWKSYHKALRHRNAALKNPGLIKGASLLSWEISMCEEARLIDRDRCNYIDKLDNYMANNLNKLLAGDARLNYKRGWDRQKTLEECLVHQRESDRLRGFTQSGPHRADVCFYMQGLEVGKILSRGQMKLYGASLTSGQVDRIKQESGKKPIVLIDDIDAELDNTAQGKLFNELLQIGTQCFVTSLDPSVGRHLQNNEFSRFHVEHDNVVKMVK